MSTVQQNNNNINKIKSLKPSRNSRFQQGYVDTKSCKKLLTGQTQPVIYRSSYEKKFIIWLERSPYVTGWASECLGIEYISGLDGKTHTYYPDYYVETNDGQKLLVEIKPYSQTIKPDDINNAWANREYIRNISKWKAAQAYCESFNDLSFKILTERTIDKL